MIFHIQRNMIVRGFIKSTKLSVAPKIANISVIHKRGFKNFAHEDEKLNPWECGYPIMILVLALSLFNYKKLNQFFQGKNLRQEEDGAYNENIKHVYLDDKEEPPEVKFFDALALDVLEMFGRNDSYKIKETTTNN